MIEVDDGCPAQFEGVGGCNGAGAPNGGTFGINGCKAIFKSLFDWLLHCIQIDFTVALNVNVGV